MANSIGTVIIRPDQTLGGSQHVARLWQMLINDSMLLTLSDFDTYENSKSQNQFRRLRLTYLLIRRERPNVIVVFMPNTLIGLLPLVMLFPNIKWIYRESNLISKLPFFKNYWYKYIYRYALNRVDIIVAQSRAMRKELEVLTTKKVVTINNIIASKGSVEVSTKSSPKRYLWAGRFCEQKNPLRAVDIFLKNFDREEAELHFVGDGILKDKIISYAITRMALNKIKILPPTELNWAFCMKYEAMIFTSRYEGFPNTVLDALSSGLSVYSTNFLGGYTELSAYLIWIPDDDKVIEVDLKYEYSCSLELNRFAKSSIKREIYSQLCLD